MPKSDLWCGCGGARWYVVEHYRRWKEELGPSVKACMCTKWRPMGQHARNRFKPGTDSNFYQLLEDGRVVACEPFAPHVFKAKRRAG